jgi:cell wall-associated NlpC family hydrolase
VPKPDQLLVPASVVGVVAGVALFVGSATATSAVAPLLRTAPFTSSPTTVPPPTTATTTTTTVPSPPAEPPPPPPPPPPPSPADQVVAFALAQQGHPYRKGAAGPRAFDCSGLILAAYATVGVDLPHWSVAQAQRGRAVDWRHEPIEPGDLVFTRGDNPVIDLGHVGLAVSETEWVVASRPGAPVRVAALPSGIQRVRRIL